MNHTKELNRILRQLRQEPLSSLETLNETARQIHPLLMRLAREGGAGECAAEDLRIALRFSLKRNVLYDSNEEWKEKRTALLDTIIEAINEGRDSRIWLRLLTDALTGREADRIIGRLRDAQIEQSLFPALEEEAEFMPTGKLMHWYSTALDRSGQYKAQILNRLAYFFLWYGEEECDEIQARKWFREMEQQGIEPKNPYPGTFGEHGHDVMIQRLLSGEANAAAGEVSGEVTGVAHAGVCSVADFRLLTEYAKEQLAQVAACGMYGSVAGCEDVAGNVWHAWIEDPNCRDLRESMRRMYNTLLAQPSEEELRLFDAHLRNYAVALRMCMAYAKPRGAKFVGSDRRKAATFLLALLLHYDNWLLRIIDLECELAGTGDQSGTGEQRSDCIAQWLAAIKPFCGKDFIIGEELLVMNSLQENLIHEYEKPGDRQEVKILLEKQVYGADALAVLSALGEEVGAAYYGHPWCTHNAMALLKIYRENGENAKARRLVRDIAETEKMLPPDLWGEDAEGGRWKLRRKYDALLQGEMLRTGTAEAQAADQPVSDKKPVRSLLVTGGCVIAYSLTGEEQHALEHTFRTAPPLLRGDFIRFLYAPSDGRDWFGLTEERRKELLNSYITT